MRDMEIETEIYGEIAAPSEERTARAQLIVDVIIPVYRPDKRFARILTMLGRQTYPVSRIIIMNTESRYWNGNPSSDKGRI